MQIVKEGSIYNKTALAFWGYLMWLDKILSLEVTSTKLTNSEQVCNWSISGKIEKMKVTYRGYV